MSNPPLRDKDYFSNLPIPLLHDSEIQCGRLLGQGSFCTVHKVKKILLSFEGNHSEQAQKQRERLAKRFDRTANSAYLAIYGRSDTVDPSEKPTPRVALKRLRDDLPAAQWTLGQEDLQVELDILLTLPLHPNILQVYAVCQSSEELFAQEASYSLVLEQIHSTLPQHLTNWRSQKGLGVMEHYIGSDMSSFRTLWVERLVLLSRVANAIAFLHSHHVLFRDIKAENVGFVGAAEERVPKLFDFGLAKRVPGGGENERHEWNFTSETGTLRYMAPEVALGKNYGFAADIHSLAILMHEVLSLLVPFADVPSSHFVTTVMKDGLRPQIDPSWPDAIKELLVTMWHEESSRRPVSSAVEEQLEDLLRGADMDLYPKHLIKARRRRSLLF